MTYFASPLDGAAWITGASSGIGRAVALSLSDAGWTVYATARDKQALDELAAEAVPFSGEILPAAGDVTDAARMAKIVETIVADHGSVALAFLNAGVYLPVKALPFDLKAYETSISINLNGTVRTLAPLIPYMTEAGRGHIVLMASVAGYSGLPTSAAYGATKAGLINLAESLKFDLDPHGVRISVVNPGFVRTPATDKNPFPMPCLMEVNDAVDCIMRGLASPGFEITFPKRFTFILKFLRLLPYALYFRIVRKITGAS